MKKALLTLTVLAMMCIISCGGVAILLNAPQITSMIVNETSVTIFWEADSAIENHIDFNGYNVYVHADSTELLVENAEDLNKNNATVIDENTYTISGLNQDTVYYIQIRTVNTDNKVGGYNELKPFVKASPRPEFTIVELKLELQAVVTDEDSCALRFETGEILNEVDSMFPDADVFADKIDADSAQLVSADARPSGRSTLIAKLDTTIYSYDDWDFSGITSITEDRQVVRDNDLLLCITEEGNYVKVLIEEVNLTANYIMMIYAYQNVANFPYLSP